MEKKKKTNTLVRTCVRAWSLYYDNPGQKFSQQLSSVGSGSGTYSKFLSFKSRGDRCAKPSSPRQMSCGQDNLAPCSSMLRAENAHLAGMFTDRFCWCAFLLEPRSISGRSEGKKRLCSFAVWLSLCCVLLIQGCPQKVKAQIAQSCLTLCYHTVHGILQNRILEWVAFTFSRASSQPRDRSQVSCIAGRFFTSWATRGPQEYWSE